MTIQPEPDEPIETFAVRTKRRLRWLTTPLKAYWRLVLRYMGAYRGEGEATL